MQRTLWPRRGGLILLCLATTLVAAPARADDAPKGAASLWLVPDDAAFYSAWLRNREQIQAVAKSNAWARLQALPAAQLLRTTIEQQMQQPGNPFGQAHQFLQQPENQQLLELLGDMFSDEVFVYGGAGFADFTQLLMESVSAVRFGPALAAVSGDGKGKDPNKLQIQMLLQTLTHNKDRIKVPDLVFGFRLRKADVAEAQLKRLETVARAVLDQEPMLKGRLKRTQIGGSSFLTLTLDGSMVPWDQLPLKDYEDQPGEYDALLKHLRSRKLSIHLGVRDGYLLLGLGESGAGIARLGGGKSLADRPELKRLAPYADRRLTSVSYTSLALRRNTGTTKEDVQGMAEVAEALLQKAKLTDEQRQQLKKDMTEFGKEMQKYAPEPGAALAFSFLTDRGQESYAIDWTRTPGSTPAKPLTLLDHVGGAPLIACVGRSSFTAADYGMLAKWAGKAYHHFETIGLPMLGAKEREQYDQFAKPLLPIVKRLSDVTEKMLLPALADGQWGLVLDAKISSRQWIRVLPPTEKPLPMLEPAIVCGVSDAELLQKAFGEYRTLVNQMIVKIGELSGQDISAYQIPAPQSKKLSAGTLYYYPTPDEVGLDAQLTANAGVSDHVAVLSVSPKQTERVLRKTPLKLDGGPLADRNRPLSSAVYVRWADLVTALTPWADYAVQMTAPMLPPLPIPGQPAEVVQQHVETVLEVLKVFRTYTSATYHDDGAWVTHGEIVIRDLEKR